MNFNKRLLPNCHREFLILSYFECQEPRVAWAREACPGGTAARSVEEVLTLLSVPWSFERPLVACATRMRRRRIQATRGRRGLSRLREFPRAEQVVMQETAGEFEASFFGMLAHPSFRFRVVGQQYMLGGTVAVDLG